MSVHLKHATVLAILVLVVSLAESPVSAQTRVEDGGRAFDAPGASNSANTRSDASLTDPYSPSVAGSINNRFRLNRFDANLNLPNLSAAVDPNTTLLLRAPSFNPVTNRDFNLQGIGLSSSSIDPYGLSALSGSATFTQPSFAIPSPTTAFSPRSLGGAVPASTGGGVFSRAFDPSGSSLPSSLSRFSAPTSVLSNSLQTTLDGAISNLDQILYNTTYDKVELGLDSGSSPAMGVNPFARSTASQAGLIETNFGFTPASGTLTPPLPSAFTSDGFARDFQMAIRATSAPASPTAIARPLETQANDGTEEGIYDTTLLGDSLIQKTLQDAWQTTSTGTDTDTRADFMLPQSPTAGDPLRPSQAVYAEMLQSVQRIKRLRDERARIGQNGDGAPDLSDAYDRALSFVRGTEQEPLSSLVGDDLDPTTQIARKAEQYLKDGAYYRALTSYEVALVSDRDNPLLLLGQGHALIGSGEHYGAVRKIAKAIENFPEIAYFKLDLNKFIPDAALLDIRRADLETRLAEHEDYRLRFLLGYIEYYIGLPEFGVKDLQAAALAAPKDSPIARFPEMLELGNTLRLR